MLVNIPDITYTSDEGGEDMAVNDEAKVRVLVTFPKDLLHDVDEYWHEQRLPNRNEGIRQLIQIGLGKEKAER